ncbi:MAG: acetoin utilization protein AcuC [Pseudomonadota bacterium]
MTRDPAKPIFIGSEIYRGSSYGAWHPLRVPRVSTVMDLVRAQGWLDPEQYRSSPRAKPEMLSAWHDPAYLSALQEAEASQSVDEATRRRYGLGTPSNPVYAEMFRRPATAAGGSILAGELLAQGGTVYSPGGGTHHGMPDHANGFCYLNDPVLAILSLRHHGADRVLYIDVDAHHPDGVEHAFADDPSVVLASVHEENRWPRTGALADAGAGQVFNLPVPSGLNDSEFAHIRDQLLLPLIQASKPDAIVLQCGADALLEDPQARLALSNGAHWDLVRSFKGLAPRFLVLGGGGYNPWSVGRCWSGVWAVLNGFDPTAQLTEPAQAVLRDLTWEGPNAVKSVPAHWTTQLYDTPRPGPIREEIKARVAQLRARL